MRITQIVASISDEAAGPSYSAPRLSTALAEGGAEVSLFTLGKGDSPSVPGVTHRTFRQDFATIPLLSQLRLSAAMSAALRGEAARVDVLHTHGLWLMPNVYPIEAARASGKVSVISPRGMLGAAALAFSGRKKRLMWAAFQREAAMRASLLHATSQQELEDIRAMGLRNPVAVVVNGIDIPPASILGRRPERTALALGRIHPKKGLPRLVEAWSRLGERTREWRLKIVGPDELGHSEELRRQIGSLNLTNVGVEGPVFGADKLATYRQSDLFVLSTLNENFAMTVAEALAAGIPVLSTRGAPWAGLERHDCGWWIDHGVEAMVAGLSTALQTPRERLSEMGANGRAWMERDFSWEASAQAMISAYSWAISGGAPPSNLHLDE